MKDIVRLAHTVEYLVREKDKREKAKVLKLEVNNGYLTEEEAFELALEYCT